MASLLIVDDDLMVQRALIRALREHICVAACNGCEALRLLGVQPFDLVISDVDMPVMNGLDFYRKARELFPNLRIIFRTGSKVPGLASIGVPVLPKDWPLTDTLEAIDSFVTRGVTHMDAGTLQGKALSEMGGR
jgi:CheY-like chemotaxis protein